MHRVTPASATANETALQPDHWYACTLQSWSIEAKGTPGYKGQPRKHARLACEWHLTGTEGDLIFDWRALPVGQQRDATLAMCRLLICALAGRDPRHEATPWIDTDTLE